MTEMLLGQSSPQGLDPLGGENAGAGRGGVDGAIAPVGLGGKADCRRDAEALCEAMSRPTMRFVPVKTAEQQAALMLVGVRDRLIRNRTLAASP